jgi:hypothetical protein
MDKIFDVIYENDELKSKVESIKLYEVIFNVIHKTHLKKFKIYINEFTMSGLKLSLFYKLTNNNLLFIESFFLDCSYPLKHILNWQNFDHNNFENYSQLTDIDFKFCYKMILNSSNTIGTNLNRGNIIQYNNDVIKLTSQQTDGYHINNNDINFQIMLWEYVQMNYGNLNINKIRSCEFKHFNQNEHIFYQKFYDESIYLRNMIRKQSLYCDKCKNEIHSFKDKTPVKEHWDYNGIFHMCMNCMKKKKQKEIDRKNYIKRIILLEGKKIVFNRMLKIYRQREYDIKPVKDIKFYKNLICGLVSDIEKNNSNKVCSICFDYFSDKKIAAADCGHCFHVECCKYLKSCPICRNPNPNFKELYF